MYTREVVFARVVLTRIDDRNIRSFRHGLDMGFALRTCYAWAVCLCSLCLVLGGCASLDRFIMESSSGASFGETLVAVRYMQIRDDDLRSTEFFYTGEIPAVRFEQRGGSVLLMLIYDDGRRKLVNSIKADVSSGRVFYWPFPELEPGNYTVYAKSDGLSQKGKCSFTVVLGGK